MEETNKSMITGGIGAKCFTCVDNLAKALMEVYRYEDTNPINLGITIEEYNDMKEVMEMKPKKKNNGFLEDKKMNKILGKRKWRRNEVVTDSFWQRIY